MKTSADCFVCYLKQSLRVARMYGCSKAVQMRMVQEVAQVISELDPDKTPPANAMPVYCKINEVTGCNDPYSAVKRMENRRALQRIELLRDEVMAANEPLQVAIGYAIAGNIIDYGAFSRVSIEDALRTGRQLSFGIDHSKRLLAKINSLSPGDKVLYLADNCGEIVYDSLVVGLLADKGLEVTVAVRGGAIINDATLEDAKAAGMDLYGKIITSGIACPGTPLDECSELLLEHFNTAALVISKGQGNFETLSEVEREVFFLLTVKCNMVGKHLADIAGVQEDLLPGDGEMVVYCSDRNKSG